jgi:hypothetical protein
MKTYTFNTIIGEDSNGAPVYQEFVIEAENFAEARHKLAELIEQPR